MTTNTNKKNILLIDSNSNYFPSITNFIDLNKSDFIIFDSNEHTYNDVIQMIRDNNNNYESIGIFQNNSNLSYYQFSQKEKQCLFDNDSTLNSWNEYINFLNLLKTEFLFINLDLIVCALYSEPKWKFVIDTLETQLQIQISTSININQIGYWFLETNKGTNLRDVYFINQQILEIIPQISLTKKLLLIDNRIKDIELIINSLNDNTYCIVFNYFYDTYETLLSKIRFLSGSNRYILDNFFYQTPELPVRKDSEGNHCTTCEEFSIDDLVLSPATLESEYLNNNSVWDFYSDSTNITIQNPVFFQRSTKIEINSSIIYRKRPFVNITDLDAIYQLAQTSNQVTNMSFECIGIIQHTVQPYLGYKLINNIQNEAIIEDIQLKDSNLLSWSSFSSFIQTLKTLYQITTLDLMACALYANPDWKYIIDNLSIKNNITIRASNDNTGSSNYGGNWILETNDINLTNVYFTDKIYEWQYVLATYIDNRFYGLRFNDSMYATKSYDARLKITAGTSNFTIETWYYETAARYNCTIVDMGDYNYTFQIRNLNVAGAGGVAFTNRNLNNGNDWLYAESAVVPIAQWSHLAITRSGSTFTFYVNGVARQTFTNSTSLYSNDSTFAIGWQSPDTCSCNRMRTDCVLYDIRLWNIARTASEIQMNRNRVIPANSSGLVANYLCTDNSNTFNDRTSNALHATIQNYDSTRWSNSLVPIPNVGFLINNGYSLTSYNSTALNALSHFDNITNTDFSNLNLSGVNFTNANLTGCKFISANLSNAILNGANLTNADLTNATLDGTYLIGATLTGAITTGSTIASAITTTTLTKSNSSAFYLTPPTGTTTTYGPTWSQLGSTVYGANANDYLGFCVSISKDGNIIAVSSPGSDITGTDRGFVKVFSWNGSSWAQRGGTFYGISNNDLITSSKLSADGNYLVFSYNDTVVSNKGFTGVYIYDSNKIVEDTNVNSASYGPIGWSRVGGFIYNESTNNKSWDKNTICISGNGQIIAIGCDLNDGTSGSASDNRGNVRVYRYDPSKLSEVTDQANANFGPVGWTRMGVDIDGESAGDNFGAMIDLSTDGTVLAGAAINSDVNGTDNGQIRVFKWNNTSSTWVQRGRTIYGQLNVSWDTTYRFANTLSLSADGNVIACGSNSFASYAGITKTLKWNSFNNDYQIVGQQLKEYGDWQLSGHCVSLSSDGQILVVGAYDSDRGIAENGTLRVYKLTTYATTLVSTPPTNMIGYTRDDTTIYRMTITGNSLGGTVSGTNLYTADSNIARAAVHAGVIANGETKEVYIKMERFQYKYFGSTRNGVTTNDYTDSSMTYLSYYFMDSPKLWVQLGNEIAGQSVNMWIGFTCAVSGDGTRFITGGWANSNGLYQVYSLSSTDNYSHTSSASNIAEVYGDIVIPKKAGFTTIASKQSSTITTSLLAITGTTPTFSSFPSVSKFTNDSQFTLTLPESNSTGAFILTTGTVSATVKYTRNALRFDGVNDTVVLNSYPTLNSTNQITLEGWVFVTTFPSSIITLNDHSGIDILADGKISTFLKSATSGWLNIQSSSAVPLNTWFYIAIVKNDNGYNKIYINNNIVNNTADTSSGNLNTCIGISFAANAQGSTNYSNIILSEFRIWSVARTEKQIRDNYNREVLSNSTGLHVYYKFNQGTAGGNNAGLTTLTDSTSNNYHGTLTNFALSGTTSNYVTGVTMLSKDKYTITNETPAIATINPDVSVNALNFNGTNNSIDLVSNITEMGQGNFTIECWIKTTGSRMGILNCQDSDNPPVWEAGEKSFYLDSSGKPAFVGFGNNFILSTQAVDDNNWHHIAVVWSYSTSTGFIYIDGQDRTNKLNNLPYQAINNNTGRFIVGVPNNSESVNYFSGSMCELRIWSIARTASQIYQNFRRILNGDESGLVCYNRLNQGTPNGSNSGLTSATNNMLSGGYAGTLSGFSLVSNTSNWTDGITLRPNKDITITGAGVATITAIQEETGIYDVGTTTATVTVVLKNFSSILTLDGVDDAVNIGIPAWTYSTQFRTTMTVECWFKTSDTNNQKLYTQLIGRNISGGVSSSAQFSIYMLPTGEIGFGLTNNNNNLFNHTTTLTYKDTQWHHVVGTYDSATGTKIIYIDGVAVKTDINSGFGLLSNNTTVKLIFGSDDSAQTDRQFRGSLSDIRIWSVVRTASEISNNYKQRLIGNETGLLGYWKLNQGYGSGWGLYTIALDSTSNRSNGTLTNFTTASNNWTLSSLAFLPRISDITLGSKNGLYNLSDSSFTFTDPLSNSFGNFSYAINSAVATISNGSSTTKTVYTTSGAITIPTLSLYDFPEIASLADWEINVSFTVTGGAGSWRALLGDMYNEINSSRGWGIWVSQTIPSKIHWSFLGNTFEPAQTLVSLNTPYILNVVKSSAGTITLTLQNVAGTYNNSLSISNLVAQYNFDSNGNDTSSNNNTLTNVNTVTFNTSNYKRGSGAALFNGTNYFEIANDGRFSPDNFTVALWINPKTINSYQSIASCRGSSPWRGWMIYIGPSEAGSNLEIWSSTDGSNFTGQTSLFSGFGTINTWVHLAFTLNKSSSALIVYINGTTVTTTTLGYTNNTTTNLRIGAGANEQLSLFHLVNGTLMDDFRFYNKVLSASEIGSIVADSSFSSVISVGSNVIGKGPVTIGGWRSIGGEIFSGTISNVNVKVPTNQRLVTLVSNTSGTPATITATQDSFIEFDTGTKTASLSIGNITPTLSNFTITAKDFGSSPFTLSAPTSNSPGTFTYDSSNTAVATISGSTVTIVGAGTSTITATQASSGSYVSGTIVATLTVNTIAPTLSNFIIPAKNYGDTPFTLSAPTSNSSGAFTYTSSNILVATISGITVTILGGGTTTITATQAATGNYTTSTITATFTVNTIAPIMIITAPGSITQIGSYITNSVTQVGQPLTHTIIGYNNQNNIVKISANGTIIGIGGIGGNDAGIVRMYGFANETWTQIGGDIVGSSAGVYAGVSSYAVGNNTISMSGDGTLLTTVQSGLGYQVGLINIYKYDASKSTAQTNSALANYGPAKWSRITTISMTGSRSKSAVLSKDGCTMVVSDFTLRMYRSDDGGVTWTQRGTTIIDPANGTKTDAPGFSNKISVSANGLTVLAATEPMNANGDPAQLLCYEWNGSTWIGTVIRTFSWGNRFPLDISADGNVCLFGLVFEGYSRLYRYTKNGSGIWTMAAVVDVDKPWVSTLTLLYEIWSSIEISANGSLVSFTKPSYGMWSGSTELGDAEVYFWNGSAYEAVINNHTIKNRTGSTFVEFDSMISSDVPRVVVGGVGKVDVYDLTGISNIIKTYGDPTFRVSATSNSPGTFTYTSSNTSIATISDTNLITIIGSGTSTITATQASTTNYTTSNITVNVIVSRVIPTITNFTVPAKNFNDTAFSLIAPTSNSSGAFTYTSSNTAVATISGSTVTIVSAGSSTITATQALTTNYTSSTITSSLVVSPIAPTLSTFTATGKNYGDAVFNLTPPTTNSSGAFTYTSSNTAVATISGSTVTILGGGTTTITATQAASGNYASGTITSSFVVSIPSGISSPTFTKESNQWYFNFQYGGSTQLTLFTINLTWKGGFNGTISFNQDFSSLTSSYGTNKYLTTFSQSVIIGNIVTATINYTESGVAKQTITTFVPNPVTGGPYTTGISNFNTNILPATCTATIPSALDQQRVDAGRGWHYSIRFTETSTGTMTGMASFYASGGLQSSFPVTIPMALYGKTFTCQLIIYNDGGGYSGDFIVQNYNTTNNTSFTIPHPTGIYPTQVTELWHTGMNWQTGGPLEDTRLYRVRWFVSTTGLDINSPNYVSKVRVNIKLSSDSGYRFTGVYNYADGLGYSMFHSSIRSPLGQNIGTWIVDIRTENSDATITTSYQTLSQYGGVPAYGNYFTLDQLAAEAGSSIIQYGENVASTFKVSNFAQSSGYTWTLNGGQIYKYLTNVLFKSASMYGTSIGTYKHKLELINPDATKTTIGLYDMNGSSPNITMWPLNPSSTYTVKITIVDSSQNEITNFFAMTNGYDTATFQSVSLVVPAAPSPTLSNFTVPAKNYGAVPFNLTAPTSNSSGAFTYTSSNTDIATISGITVTIVGGGTTTITATQADSGTYGSGTIIATLVVSPIVSSLSNFTIATKYFGQPTFTITAPTTNSNGTFTYTSSNTAVATISGSTVTILSVGTSTITATLGSTANYTSGSVVTTLTVNSYENANLTGLDLAGSNLTSLNLSNSTLTNVKSGSIIGNPTLPANYILVNGYIIGPNVNLTNVNLSSQNLTNANFTGANLTGANLTSATLTGLVSGSITGTPTLSASYSIINGYILGPSVNLSSIDLTGVTLTGANLSGITVNTSTVFTNAVFTNVTSGNIIGTTTNFSANYNIISGYIIGPSVNLVNATLSGANLSSKNLTDVNLTGANLTGANLSSVTINTSTNFTNATLTNVSSGSLSGTTSTFPTNYNIIGGYVVGPSVNLSNAVLSGLNLNTKILTGVNFTNANLTNVVLTGSTIDSSTNMTNATLTNITTGSLIGTSTSFSSSYNLINGYVVGPSVNLSGANLSGQNLTNKDLSSANLTNVNLTSATLTGLKTGSITGTPTLSANYVVVNNYILGPSVNLTNANLANQNLTNVNLSGANLSGTVLTNATLTGLVTSSITGVPTMNTAYTIINGYIVGPSVNLANANLSGQDLTGKDLTNVNLSNANLSDATTTNIILSNTNINNANLTNITFSNTQKVQLLKNTNNRSISGVQISNLSGTDILSLLPNSTISTINNISSIVFKVIPPSVENTIDLSLVTTGAFYIPSATNESIVIDGKTYYSTSSAIINSSTGLAIETLTFGTKIYKLFSGSVVGVELNLDTYKIYGVGFSNIFEGKGTLSSFSNSITAQKNLAVVGTSTLTGNVGINKSPSDTYKVDILGTVRASLFTTTSDYRIKEDINYIQDIINIDDLKPVKYKNKLNNKMEYGFIAHEVQDIFPEIVEGDKDGEEYQSINYSGLIPILVNEIKKLKEEIKNLKK